MFSPWVKFVIIHESKGAYIVRLLMVGDSSCGKTSLVLRFDQNVFSTKFVTTIGVDYRDKMVKVSVCLRNESRKTDLLWKICLYLCSIACSNNMEHSELTWQACRMTLGPISLLTRTPGSSAKRSSCTRRQLMTRSLTVADDSLTSSEDNCL